MNYSCTQHSTHTDTHKTRTHHNTKHHTHASSGEHAKGAQHQPLGNKKQPAKSQHTDDAKKRQARGYLDARHKEAWRKQHSSTSTLCIGCIQKQLTLSATTSQGASQTEITKQMTTSRSPNYHCPPRRANRQARTNRDAATDSNEEHIFRVAAEADKTSDP